MALKSILLCEVGLRFTMASVFYVFSTKNLRMSEKSSTFAAPTD